jgi:YegS/Rv2252/BmrU family lipid kinase
MINFIVNSNSGRGRGNKVLKKLCDYCYRHNVAFSAHRTARAGDAAAIAKKLSSDNAGTIAAVGGDGTFFEVLNGVKDPKNTAIGFIPAGRGNDYARTAGLSLNPVKALEQIISGKIVYKDYISVGNKRCLNVAGTGLDVAVLKRVDGRRGKLTYISSLIYCLKHFEPYKLNITVNGVTATHECIMAGVCNGGYIGGGINISPSSKTDDGKIDLVIMRVPKNGKLMNAMITFKMGRHLSKEYTTHIVCDEVSVIGADIRYPIQIDGEIFDDEPLVCAVVGGGLKTFG